MKKLFNCQFILFCSKISFELYLVHFWLLRLLIKGNITSLLYFLALSFLGAWIFYVINHCITNKLNKFLSKKIKY